MVRLWAQARDRERYGAAITAAREGIRVFAAAGDGARLRALRADDWRFLLEHCDADVRDDVGRGLHSSTFQPNLSRF